MHSVRRRITTDNKIYQAYNKHIQLRRISSGLRDAGEIHWATVATKTTVTPAFAQAGRQIDHRERVVIVDHLTAQEHYDHHINICHIMSHGSGQGKNMGKSWNQEETWRNLRLESMWKT